MRVGYRYVNQPEPPLSAHSLTVQPQPGQVEAMREDAARTWTPAMAALMQVSGATRHTQPARAGRTPLVSAQPLMKPKPSTTIMDTEAEKCVAFRSCLLLRNSWICIPSYIQSDPRICHCYRFQAVARLCRLTPLPLCLPLRQATARPFINAIFDRDPLSRWVFDRVVLVGEAAHPVSARARHPHLRSR